MYKNQNIILFALLFIILLASSISGLGNDQYVYSKASFEVIGQGYKLCVITFPRNFTEPGPYNLTVRVLNASLAETCSSVIGDPIRNVTGAIVVGNVTYPDSSSLNFSFFDLGNGNYTILFNFTQNGAYNVLANASKNEYINASNQYSMQVGTIITRFLISPTNPYQDETTTFIIDENNSDSEVNLYLNTTELRFYTSGGAFIESVSLAGLTGQTLAPGSSITSTYLRNFPTYAPGIYIAQVLTNYTYNDGQNFTQRNSTFEVRLRPPAPGGPGGGGGGGGGGVAPPAVPLEFLKHPILRETPTGNPVLTDITMKNPTSKNASVSISLDGVPTNWVQEVQSAGIIPPGQTKTETLAITVPKNADPGDYLVGMNVNTGGTSGKSKFVLRVKEYPEEYRVPQVYTAVDVDFADNTSNVKLSVQNNQVFRQSVFIYQTIPKSVAKSTDEIDFQTAPTKIINNEPVVLWILQDVQQNQKQDLSYDVKSIVSEYEPYVYYLSNEVVAISVRQEDYIKITNVFSSPLVAGVGNNYVNVELTNTYTNPINVSASLFTIQRWSIAPEEAQIMINPRATETVRFNVTVPPETKSGTYAGSIFLRYQNVTTSKDISLVVGVGVQIGVLGFDIIYWVILIGILILLASYIISKRVYGKEFMKYTSREDRFKVLKDIRDIIKRK